MLVTLFPKTKVITVVRKHCVFSFQNINSKYNKSQHPFMIKKKIYWSIRHQTLTRWKGWLYSNAVSIIQQMPRCPIPCFVSLIINPAVCFSFGLDCLNPPFCHTLRIMAVYLVRAEGSLENKICLVSLCMKQTLV